MNNGTPVRRQVSARAQAKRDPSFQDTDKAALRAIAQAAVEVELFTIPLYMVTMYSIQGMHQITSKGNAFYEGRLWPGAATTAKPESANEKAFNIIFSVLIQEMLHLQLASNMATAIGITPDFTSSALQTQKTHAWTCYGPKKSIIPHIIDLKDTINYSDVAVNLGPVCKEQLRLFLAIEQPEADAEKEIPKDKQKNYFPTVPFSNWKQGDPLPLFGTIGWMYQCYFDYLHLQYTDGKSLWELVFNGKAQQNDLFNNFAGPGHPMREFMGFESTIALTYPDIAFQQMLDMMDAITDQGEGSVLKLRLAANAGMQQAVEQRYRPSLVALESDYPDFTDTGALTESADAPARYDNDNRDHYERFQEVMAMLPDIVTWWPWLQQHGAWTAKDLMTKNYAPSPQSKVPAPEAIAAALNALAKPDAGGTDYFKLLSQASIGAIAGVTTVLDKYWSAKDQQEAPVSFPFPSMAGAGDRTSICWAVLGKAPDLSLGLEPPEDGKLYHSCQAIDYAPGANPPGSNQCAPVTVFHSCRGSNGCRAQGGCGFVQPTTGGGSCGGGGGSCSSGLATGTAIGMRTFGALCGQPSGPAYSAPGDNKCGTFGGCAVPISASQLFPAEGTMQLFRFQKVDGQWKAIAIDEKPPFQFHRGDNVHDVAWAAYRKVMGLPDSQQPPPPTPLRLAFPPST